MAVANILIPKLFHQIWLGDKPIPDSFKQWSGRWLALNGGWPHGAVDRRSSPRSHQQKQFDAADKMAAKSDILRYEVIARHGGIYIDSDFEPLRPIEELLVGVNCFYGDERPDTPCNAILGCVKEDPLFFTPRPRPPRQLRRPRRYCR